MEPIPETIERIGTQIVDAVFQLHSKTGPGLLESVYETCLAHNLRKRGLRVQRQVSVPILYDGLEFDEGFRIDLLVEDCVIIELKATTQDHPIFRAQLITYLHLTNLRLGFLINFHKKLIKDGIERIVL